ncbi:MAG: hypothetical protein OEY05_13270 [Paracoccaceae bacterium]|nr:hypothetical protein [Paracoccaceae bacterium]
MSNRFNVTVVIGVFSFAAVILMWRLRNAVLSGGNGFTHADWLINYSSGVIRRGISGEIFLSAAAALEAHPLVLVGIVQAVLTLAIIVGLGAKGLMLRMPDQVLVLLLSPALVLFWVNDTFGAFRKEILGLASFVPLLFPLRPAGETVAVCTTLFLFLCAVFFHEANIFLAPALMLALYLRLGAERFVVPVALVGVFAGASVVFSAVFLTLPDTTGICQRMVAAGLQEDRMCHGILTWLDDGVVDQARTSSAVIADMGTLPVMVLLGAMLLLPGLAIAWGLLSNRERVAFLVSVATLFVVYLIASDWSRWLSMQVFAMTYLILIAMDRRDIDASLQRPAYSAALVFNLGIGIDQIAPVPRGGLIYNVLASFENFTS